MGRFKGIYIIIIGILTIIVIGFVMAVLYKQEFTQSFDHENVNVLVGIIALIIAIISMGIADPKLKQLRLKISVWKRKEEQIDGGDKINSLAFHLENLSKVPLEDLVVTFRFESSIYDSNTENNQNNSYFEFGDRIVVQNDTIKYLGINVADNWIRFQHYVKDFQEWDKGKIAITVSCREFVPTTIQIDVSDRDAILEARNERPKNYYINMKAPKLN
ncbi:MAG: hypothetical protein KJO25_07390 [Bacteroidia bacterium]|nr:hypothetical protein [Bacteroidia bacterium]NNK73696.1 hypothetical protein [Flavobacteriaceae bacterium]